MTAVQEDNFNEAISNAHKMWSPPGIRECACTLCAVVHGTLARVCKCACKAMLPCESGGYYYLTAAGAAADVQAIMQDEAAESASSSSDDFWVLAAALKRFVENEGCGSLPLEASHLWHALLATCLPHAATVKNVKSNPALRLHCVPF